MPAAPESPELTSAKQAALAAVDELRPSLIELSHAIHAEPELAFQEHISARRLVDFLRSRGLPMTAPYLDLPTAFRGESGTGDPCVAIIAEYDALPGIGHGCGHNIIAAAAAGAVLAASEGARGKGGRVAIIGTPAEEAGAGKAVLIERGAFDDTVAAMMVHPADRDAANVRSLAMTSLEVRFRGHAAHAAAAPWQGVNALDAMVISYNAISVLRQQLRESARVHGVITEGGKAANIIPEEAVGSFMIRAEEGEYLAELTEKVLNCFRAGAQATGCQVEFKPAEAPYLPLNTNPALADAYTANLERIGRTMFETGPGKPSSMGSTDMGNVSLVVPAIHPKIAAAPPGVPLHTPEFEAFAAEPIGDEAVIDGAKALALTALDVLFNAELRDLARRQFESGLPAFAP